jgi:hypothetical protein
VGGGASKVEGKGESWDEIDEAVIEIGADGETEDVDAAEEREAGRVSGIEQSGLDCVWAAPRKSEGKKRGEPAKKYASERKCARAFYGEPMLNGNNEDGFFDREDAVGQDCGSGSGMAYRVKFTPSDGKNDEGESGEGGGNNAAACGTALQAIHDEGGEWINFQERGGEEQDGAKVFFANRSGEKDYGEDQEVRIALFDGEERSEGNASEQEEQSFCEGGALQNHVGEAEKIKDAESDAEEGKVGIGDSECGKEQKHEAGIVKRALHGVERIGDERIAALVKDLKAGWKSAEVDEAGLHGEDVDGAPASDPATCECASEEYTEKKPREKGEERASGE